MILIHDKKEIKLLECRSFSSRFKGFMLKRNINHALLFNNCNAIHTFFMLESIDVLMCDKDNNVLYFYHNLTPNKIIFPKKGVFKVIELPVNYFNFSKNLEITIKK